jgi:hypothetical protein
MHPIVILIPAAGLIFGPKAWANHMLLKHDKVDPGLEVSASELARRILDDANLQAVKVECTDTVDNYDQTTRTVRLSRDRFDRKSLSAIATAAHEAAHALQHAAGYRPFIWRARLNRAAQFTGQIGSVVLVAMPALALATHRNLPLRAMGGTVLLMLSTSLAAQLAALPSEFDASFKRALPLLRKNHIDERRSGDARDILFACSMTYIAAPLISLLSFWPWFITDSPRFGMITTQLPELTPTPAGGKAQEKRKAKEYAAMQTRSRTLPNGVEPLVGSLGKPLLHCWQWLSGTVRAR